MIPRFVWIIMMLLLLAAGLLAPNANTDSLAYHVQSWLGLVR